MLPRNIVVCADGTGNKGGYSPDSNVYKVYKMVDKHYKGKCSDGVDIKEQILFYDNGVGTAINKLWRAVSGGFGLGFRRNVCDLYKFLARNYREGDRIFFFGFSRGASTVRACNGMIHKCGLAKGEGLRNQDLDELVKEAYCAYQYHIKSPERAINFKNNPEKSHGAVPVQFLGVWDTVVALGFPKRTDITGPVTLLLNTIFGTLEKISDYFFPHSFFYYKLTDNVAHACQALAIDDERTAFWPYVWQEKNIDEAKDRTTDNVEQVWFAGMHSNVGGGYQRAGMAGVPLYWMMKRAQHHGLMFTDESMQKAYDDSHIHGRMYDSRSGFAMLYRYHPRDIEERCKNKLIGNNIKIHSSVIQRLNHRTANYAPGFIPSKFDVVDTEQSANVEHYDLTAESGWHETRRRINKLVSYRKKMYGIMLAFVLAILGYAICLWARLPDEIERKGLSGDIADMLDYFSLDLFDGLIQLIVVQKPWLSIIVITLLGIYFFVNHVLYKRTVAACEMLRHYIIESKPEVNQ
ncbi:MAG: DUF2235 domain-containing protein [Gammaproteobacteria bacterium]|nr:DUF2235 domain-containing protein [Gammaproteobacteria bacterium]MCW8909430.1 DUF2235 domain-containing protein [Gammaproteobacteria bacterium]MCW9056200.1 DUF2235 domain-containing protein [Gammaproteobacteria bacterium]